MFDSIAHEAIRGRVHPHTGELIKPAGFRKNGRPIWPIMGASEEDEGGEGGDEGGEDEGTGGDEGGEDEGADEGDDDEEAERKRKANKDAERHRRENKQLRKDLEEANKKLKEVDDADLDDKTKLSNTVTELEEKLEKAEGRTQELALHNAFLSDNSITWHDPKTALELVDLSKVEIDEDGEVEGLEDALKALAKAKPFLVKNEDDEDEDEPPSSTGTPPKKRKAANEKDRQKLIEKYKIRR